MPKFSRERTVWRDRSCSAGRGGEGRGGAQSELEGWHGLHVLLGIGVLSKDAEPVEVRSGESDRAAAAAAEWNGWGDR